MDIIPTQTDLKDFKQIFQSTVNLNLLPKQVIYVEDSFNASINKTIRLNYEFISSRFAATEWGSNFIYLPHVIEELQESGTLSYFLKYYFPATKESEINKKQKFSFQTSEISRIMFRTIGQESQLKPGLFRYVQKEMEMYIYEFIPFNDNPISLLRKIDDYIGSFPVQEIAKVYKKVDVKREKQIQEPHSKLPRLFGFILNENKGHKHTEYETINALKSAIEELKELGYYDLLLKEIGPIFLQKDNQPMFTPSQLVMNEDFRIFLPDFNNMEIEMTPLPKALFILFLRHPEGIFLKQLIDYNIELLEIYKLLSNKEDYFKMVDSINRICNPSDGSINEKLSRIREAFQKKMSMDTAQYYIVKGERGMEKKIEIDRSLIMLPKLFEEIEKTVKSRWVV